MTTAMYSFFNTMTDVFNDENAYGVFVHLYMKLIVFTLVFSTIV